MGDDKISIMTVSSDIAKKVKKKSTRKRLSSAGNKLLEWFDRIEGGTSFLESVTTVSAKLSDVFFGNKMNSCFDSNDIKLSTESEKILERAMETGNISELYMNSSKQKEENLVKRNETEDTKHIDKNNEHPQETMAKVGIYHATFGEDWYNDCGTFFRQFDFK